MLVDVVGMITAIKDGGYRYPVPDDTDIGAAFSVLLSHLPTGADGAGAHSRMCPVL